ncbi:MAG: extracellular solute-binding protein family 5 [Conexibacter sp.]|jgi:peptide/nickel transport system substrate-binding protein|nr:extracellular solute-binding protein family 5 [Conexibacter sp.]
MKTWARIVGGMLLTLALAVTVAACGGGSSSSSSSTSGTGSSGGGASTSGGRAGGSATVAIGTAPDFLDPSIGYTTQSVETTWVVYTGLLTYRHANGEAGTQLIPGLAEALPTISRDGRTYEFTIRRGLTFSDGRPVRASDFAYSVQRMLRLNWGGKAFITNYVVGASAFDRGRARTVSGITTDDATGRITLRLMTPYGAMSNVLAYPALSIVPTGTAMRNLSASPPPGVGPYMITASTPNRGWTLRRNPSFARFSIPDIPLGHLDTITFNINSNTQSEAQQVLSNQADVFDPGDTVPPALVQQIQNQARDRFSREENPSTFYFFLNTTKAPFNNERARQAVNYALDRRAMVRLASGFLTPECYFLPNGIVGHPTGACPYGSKDGAPDLARARQLVRDAGLTGAPVTVWGETRSPRKEYVDYYTNVLNQIGFKATEKIIADAVYFPTIGNSKTDPQTGFADWLQDFPNPSDFYLLLDATSIQPTNNQNFSRVNDPHVQAELKRLNAYPATELRQHEAEWQALDEYVARRAYVLVYGSELLPKFFSNKLNFSAAIFHPLYLTDLTSLQLK